MNLKSGYLVSAGSESILATAGWAVTLRTFISLCRRLMERDKGIEPSFADLQGATRTVQLPK